MSEDYEESSAEIVETVQPNNSAYDENYIIDSNGTKRFVCTHEGCNKSFTTPYNRQRHECLHTGIKPFKCTFPVSFYCDSLPA